MRGDTMGRSLSLEAARMRRDIEERFREDPSVFVPNPQVRNNSKWCPQCERIWVKAGTGMTPELCPDCGPRAA